MNKKEKVETFRNLREGRDLFPSAHGGEHSFELYDLYDDHRTERNANGSLNYHIDQYEKPPFTKRGLDAFE